MKKSRRKNDFFQEDYFLNTAEYKMDAPCLRIHSFCHSFFYPGYIATNKRGTSYIGAALILKGENIRKNPDGEKCITREGFIQVWDLNANSDSKSTPRTTPLERYFILFRTNHLLQQLLQTLFPSELPQFQTKDFPRIKKCFEEIRHILRKQGETDEYLLSAAGFRLLTEVARQLKEGEEALPKSFVLAKSCIEEQFCNAALSRENIASAAGISTTLLGKYFRKYMNMTVNDYITSLRIKRAEKLLISTDLSISETAEKCGFSYSYYFAKVFCKYTGTTPAKFRRENQK